MRVLALDPATKCGWAHSVSQDGLVVSGVWDLSIKRDESKGMRLIRLKSKLKEFTDCTDLMVYEAARNAAPKMQGALVVQATLQSVLLVWAEENNIEYRGYSPTEIKKFATGKGNANKQMMIDSARDKGYDPADDNEADALHLLHLALHEYGSKENLINDKSKQKRKR